MSEIIINEVEMAEYIVSKLKEQGATLSKDAVLSVLDLEVEFLKIKGVIEE